MRIAFFSYGILEQGGGFENFLIHTVPALNKRYKGMQIDIITCDEAMTLRLQKLLTVYHFKKHSAASIRRESHEETQMRLGSSKYIQVKNIKQLKHRLANYDVLHIKNEVLEIAVIKLLQLEKKIPLITGIHTPIRYRHSKTLKTKVHNLIYLIVYKRFIKYFAGIYVQNDDDYNLLANEFKFDKHLVKIDQGIEFAETPVTTNDDKKLRILFVGRISEEKGIDTLIEIIKLVKPNCKFGDLEFRIIGNGNKTLQNKLSTLDMKYRNVTYMGHIPHNMMFAQYEWCDVVVIPSRFETLCKIAIEAGAYGKTAVASDIAGPREIIKDGTTGFLVLPEPHEFADKLLDLLRIKKSDIIRFNKYGAAAKSYIAKKYDSREAEQKLCNLIKTAAMKPDGK